MPRCSIVGYRSSPDGSVELGSFWQLMLNPWAWWQYAHNMSGAVITGAFVMSSVGAFYLLWGRYRERVGFCRANGSSLSTNSSTLAQPWEIA
jgi:cytochrome bd-type quinol oxidase subunit 1